MTEREKMLEQSLKDAFALIHPMLPAYIMENDFFSEKETKRQLRLVDDWIKNVHDLLGLSLDSLK